MDGIHLAELASLRDEARAAGKYEAGISTEQERPLPGFLRQQI